jgi:DNA-binding IclR family transcriptional regulator
MSILEPVAKQPGYNAPAVHKAFQLLRIVAASHEPLGLTELARQLGYSKSTTHGLVHALLREGALAREQKGRRFFLGPVVSDLTFTSWNYLKVNELTQPVVDAIRDAVGETVFFGVLINKRVIILTIAEAAVPLKISGSTGTSISLFAGAVGKVFLADAKTDVVKQLLKNNKLPRYTPRSIWKEGDYLEELSKVRKAGYALDNEEYLTGLKAVAVALHNQKGPPMAVWVVGLSSAMNTDKLDRAIECLVSMADMLRRTLDENM